MAGKDDEYDYLFKGGMTKNSLMDIHRPRAYVILTSLFVIYSFP